MTVYFFVSIFLDVTGKCLVQKILREAQNCEMVKSYFRFCVQHEEYLEQPHKS